MDTNADGEGTAEKTRRRKFVFIVNRVWSGLFVFFFLPNRLTESD